MTDMYPTNTRRRGETREPIGFATYSAKAYPALCEHLLSGRPMGPNYMGELMWPVVVDQDVKNDVTRVGFSLIAPTEDD